MVFEHGGCEGAGGTFLLVYLIMTIFAGLPLVFLEMCLAQYTGQGPIKFFGNLAPAFKGLGFAMVAVSCVTAVYYNVILAWTTFYFLHGLRSSLPWDSISQANNSDCMTQTLNETQFFFKHTMLGMDKSTQLSNLEGMQWHLVGCLFFCWTSVCLALIGGIRSSGKVVYVTVLLPLLGMVYFFIRGATLNEDMGEIQSFFAINPDNFWEMISHGELWKDAAKHMLFSLSPTMGGLMILSSYNKFNTNCQKHAITVTVIDLCVSLMAGCGVFAVFGFLKQHEKIGVHLSFLQCQNKSLSNDSVPEGSELLFTIIPAVFTLGEDLDKLHAPSGVMSAIFFGTVFLLGFTSMITFVETLITSIIDRKLFFRRFQAHIVIAACMIGFLLGLIMCTQGGKYILDILNENVISWNILLFAFLELFIVMVLYGPNQFVSNIKEMGMLDEEGTLDGGFTTDRGKRLTKALHWYFKICWTFFTPLTLIVLLINATIGLGERIEQQDLFDENLVSKKNGGILPTLSVLIIPTVMIVKCFQRRNQIQDNGWKTMFEPESPVDKIRLGGRRPPENYDLRTSKPPLT